MKKIASVFQRNYDGDRCVRNEVVQGSEWVINGEGIATRKWDGMAVLVRFGEVFKRYDAKTGRTPPSDFVPAQPEADPVSGHWPGWVPAVGPDSARVMEGISWGSKNLFHNMPVPDGTSDDELRNLPPKLIAQLGKDAQRRSLELNGINQSE